MRSSLSAAPFPFPARRRPTWLAGALWLSLPLGCASNNAETEPDPTAMEATPQSSVEVKLRDAINGEHRVKSNRRRDTYRNPLITMMFFGLRDDMNVVELFPGYGYYTEILAPVLRDSGSLTVTIADPNGPPEDYATKQTNYILKKREELPDAWGKVKTVPAISTTDLSLGPDGSADMVLSFRNLASWMEHDYADKLLAAAFKVLKSGGVLGIVDHRADPGPTDVVRGYINQKDAIKLIEAAGFKLADQSEANANPRDTKDHPKGVFNLPPTYADGDVDKDKYKKIGDSDRFTLKFVKP